MQEIDDDIDSLLGEVAESEAEEDLLRCIFEWESERVTFSRRRGKNKAIEGYIEEYLEK